MVATGNRSWKNKWFQDPNITAIHYSQLQYYMNMAKLQVLLRAQCPYALLMPAEEAFLAQLST